MVEYFATVDILGIILVFVGVIFIVIEMFHPGFGFFGIVGIIALIAGIVVWARSVLEAIIILVIILALLAGILLLVLRSVRKGRLKNSGLVLNEKTDSEAGYIASEDLKPFDGKRGIALTMLRPAGMGEFDGTRLDIVTEGDFLAAQTKIIITKIEGRRVVVRELKEDE